MPPSILQSSGDALLDAAALDLARAGSGHYIPGKVDGTPVRSCMAFRVAFKLTDPPPDPNLPVLSARIKQLDEQFRSRFNGLPEFGPQDNLTPDDPQWLPSLRQRSRRISGGLDSLVDSLKDYVAAVGRLGSADDLPQRERDLFATRWPVNRDQLLTRLQDMVSTVRTLIGLMDELGDYVALAAPPLGVSGVQPTPVQRAQLESIMQRLRAAQQKLQEAQTAWGTVSAGFALSAPAAEASKSTSADDAQVK